MRYSLLVLALVACRDGSSRSAPVTSSAEPAAAAPAPAPPCPEPVFAVELPIAEASGATYEPADGRGPARVLVVSDSGNDGAFVEMAADDGRVLARGRLPLDQGASDDLEGLARVGERYYAVTSSGYMRSWRRDGDGFALVDRAYALAEPGHGAPPISCNDPDEVNCGSNIEGLCLRDPAPASGCAGYLAAKNTGRLVCLEWAGQRLVATAARGIDITAPGVISGCAFAPDDGRLLVGSNLFAANTVWQVDARGQTRRVGRLGPGFGEAIAAGPDGEIYRFSDDGGAPSASKKFVCP